MFALVSLLGLCLQINSQFPLRDVIHLVRTRSPFAAFRCIGDLKGFRGRIVPTVMPEHAIVSLESSRMHFFMHDETRITHCIWDGPVSFDDKRRIVRNVIAWANESRRAGLGFDDDLIPS